MSNDSSRKPFYVDWCAKDALDGMMHLSDIEELAYRRIIDMIYASDDNIEDNDAALRWSTKAGSKWPKIKKRLLELGKIEVVDGRISSKKCREKLEESWARIAQASSAGKASAEKRKRLKDFKSGSTGVATDVGTEVATGEPTPVPTNHQSSRFDLKKSPLTPLRYPDEDVFEFGVLMDEGFDVTHHLTDKGLEAARRQAPGWDVYKLASDFSAAVRSGKMEMPRNADKAFPAWCAKITKGKRP